MRTSARTLLDIISEIPFPSEIIADFTSNQKFHWEHSCIVWGRDIPRNYFKCFSITVPRVVLEHYHCNFSKKNANLAL